MKTKTIISIMTILIVSLSLTTNAQAYVPKEYQTSPYMSSYDVYKVSLQHTGEKWADRNLDDLMRYYGRPRCLQCLNTSIERMRIIEERNLLKSIIKIQKFPNIAKNIKNNVSNEINILDLVSEIQHKLD